MRAFAARTASRREQSFGAHAPGDGSFVRVTLNVSASDGAAAKALKTSAATTIPPLRAMRIRLEIDFPLSETPGPGTLSAGAPIPKLVDSNLARCSAPAAGR